MQNDRANFKNESTGKAGREPTDKLVREVTEHTNILATSILTPNGKK